MANDKKITVEEQLAEMRALITEQAGTIAALQASAAPAPAGKPAGEPESVPTETFTADGKKYRFTVGKYINEGVLQLAKDALKNPAELERLVAIRSGIIKLVK